MDLNRLDTEGHKLLTKNELAMKMCVKLRTIDNWMKDGRLPYLKIGKTVRFEYTSVMEKLKTYELGGME
jgi:excisionase family DNA binding protein